MIAKIVKLAQFSGNSASIYAVWQEKYRKTSFEIFISENRNVFLSELKNIISRLKAIGTKTGAREQFFKIDEGIPGDGVCASYDDPDRNLRLYCIRYGVSLIILGGGGPKNVEKLQQDETLKRENYFLRTLSGHITERLKEGSIRYVNNGKDLEGDLEFKIR